MNSSMSAICWTRLTKRSRWFVERPAKITIATPSSVLALTHLIQVIGEAARRVPSQFREEHQQIPWDAIAGMRSKIVHDYMNVDEDIVWDSVTQELQPLIDELKKIVPPESL